MWHRDADGFAETVVAFADDALELVDPGLRVIEVNNVCDQFGRRDLDFAADEDIDTLERAVINELLDQVFSDCAGGADNEGLLFLVTVFGDNGFAVGVEERSEATSVAAAYEQIVHASLFVNNNDCVGHEGNAFLFFDVKSVFCHSA